MTPAVGIGAGATAGAGAGTLATTAKPAAKSGLYVVPLSSTETLRKGLAKLQFKATSPIMEKAADFVLNKLSGDWDRRIIPAIHAALKAKGLTNIRMPSGNFIADSNGNIKPASLLTPVLKGKGYNWYARKGYDPKTKIGFLWVVVS